MHSRTLKFLSRLALMIGVMWPFQGLPTNQKDASAEVVEIDNTVINERAGVVLGKRYLFANRLAKVDTMLSTNGGLPPEKLKGLQLTREYVARTYQKYHQLFEFYRQCCQLEKLLELFEREAGCYPPNLAVKTCYLEDLRGLPRHPLSRLNISELDGEALGNVAKPYLPIYMDRILGALPVTAEVLEIQYTPLPMEKEVSIESLILCLKPFKARQKELDQFWEAWYERVEHLDFKLKYLMIEQRTLCDQSISTGIWNDKMSENWSQQQRKSNKIAQELSFMQKVEEVFKEQVQMLVREGLVS